MTLITGKLKDSGDLPYGGKITAVADAPFIVSDGLITQKPYSSLIPNTGVINFTLPESETSEVTYTFTVTDTDDNLVIPVFHAIVPNDIEVNFWELLPVPVQSDVLPAGLRRLAQIIATTPEYKNQITAFNPRGDYDATVFYVERDLVELDGSSYLYTSPIMTKGKSPNLNPDIWQLYAGRGEPGAGTTGNSTPFDRDAWTNATDAPSRGALAEVIIDRRNPTIPVRNLATLAEYAEAELLPRADLQRLFASTVSPTFSGDPKAPTKGVGDNTQSIATTAHVKLTADTLAPLNAPALTGNPTRTTSPAFTANDGSLISAQYLNQRLRVAALGNNVAQNLTNNARVAVVWSSEQIDLDSAFVPSTGRWTCPTTGYYRINANFYIFRNAATSLGGYKIFRNVTDSIDELFASITPNSDDISVIAGIIRATQGKVYEVQCLATFAGATPTIGVNLSRLTIEWIAP